MNAADGGGLVHLPPGRAPAWSPDGSKIAFTRYGANDSDIYVMHADGSGIVQLTNTPGNDDQPAWSPDGSKIAFSSTRDGNHEIYVMNATDGSGLVRLTNDALWDDHPAWSPDGSKIAFSKYSAIYVMNATDGSGLVRLTTGWADDPGSREGGGSRSRSRHQLRPQQPRFQVGARSQGRRGTRPQRAPLAGQQPLPAHDFGDERRGEAIALSVEAEQAVVLEHGEQLLDALGRETGERGDELRVHRERPDARRAQHLEARRVQLRDPGQHRLARQARDRHRERLLDGDARTGPGERLRAQDRGLLEPLQHGDDQKRVPARLEEDATGQAIEIRRAHTPGAAAQDELPRLGRGEGLELHHLARQSSRASDVAPQANQRARGLLERRARAQHEQHRPPGDLRHRDSLSLDACAVRVVPLVLGQRYGLLLGERPQQRRQGSRHLAVVGGCARC